jgi:hypothetical protein
MLDQVASAFRRAGAVSPAEARPLSDFPGVDPAAMVALVARGIVREGSPGCYYLYAGGLHERRRKLLTSVLIAALSLGLLVGLPLFFLILRA